jgi:hypothetical protein
LKITKAEKIWLALVFLFYVLYNLPGIPAYLDQSATIVHACLTLIPLWIVVYGGMILVYRKYPIRKENEDEKHD